MEENQNQFKFDAVDLVLYLWKRRWPIIITGFVAGIFSIIVSLCITEKYKSEVILFPSAAGSVSQDLLSISSMGKSILRLGEDEELDQLMQVLQSDEIRRRIIEKYDLMNHYEIKPNSKYRNTQLYKKYDNNIVIKPTKFLSVSITVWDTDPQIAADIANDISSLVDTVKNNMMHEKALLALELVKNEYDSLLRDIQVKEDTLNSLRKRGVVDYEKQAEALSSALGVALSNGNTRAADDIQKRLDKLGAIGGPYIDIYNQLLFDKERISDLRTKLAEAQIDARQNLPQKYVVNKATVAEKKSYPVRWLIVVTTTAAAVILLMLGMIIFDSIAKRVEILKEK
ncbi:MAG: hypothetical protein J6W13_13285 [Salinivirgaceae bacterium]|nr:hypothetical protein [Salinivirgaceae bacterium]